MLKKPNQYSKMKQIILWFMPSEQEIGINVTKLCLNLLNPVNLILYRVPRMILDVQVNKKIIFFLQFFVYSVCLHFFYFFSLSDAGIKMPPIPLEHTDFYGFSEFWYTTEDIVHMGGLYSYDNFANASRVSYFINWEKKKFVSCFPPLICKWKRHKNLVKYKNDLISRYFLSSQQSSGIRSLMLDEMT